MNKRKVLWVIGSILLLFLFAIFCVILKKTKVDSIRDTNQVDSYQSVSEYDYTNDRLIQHGTLLLKDLEELEILLLKKKDKCNCRKGGIQYGIQHWRYS